MRVNLIEPIYLTDNHLIAELNEINLVAMSFYRSYNASKGIFGIPDNFTLNKGHAKFFYDKGYYLHKRYQSLKREGLKREFKIVENFKNYFYWVDEMLYYNDWKPNEKDLEIIKKRITEKILLKPYLYRYYRKSINVKTYLTTLKNL